MDVETGDFKFDFRSGKVSSSNAKNGYLDPVIANEGVRVILSDGQEVTWNPPPVKPVMPDWSQIKSIRHYFDRTDFHFFPCWLFHPIEDPIVVKNAREAFEKCGVHLLERSEQEQAEYGGGKYRWKFDSEWRVTPYDKKAKFDPLNPGHGKNYVPRAPDPQIAQNSLMAQLVPTVAAAVVAAMQNGGTPNAPANVNLDDWDEFQKFLAFKKTAEAIAGVDAPALGAGPVIDDERAPWETQARELGMKIDGRWSLERLRKEVGAELERRAGVDGEDA
jgi:hypothetical protein